MVTTWLRSAAIALLITACTDAANNEQAEEVTAGAATSGDMVTLSDTASAPTVPFEEAAGDSIFLRYKPGQVLTYRTTQTAEDIQDTLSSLSNTAHVYTKKIRSIRGDGAFELEITYNQIRSTGTLKNTKTGAVIRSETFDSKDSSKLRDPRNAQFSSLLGEPVTVILTPQAKIQEISGVSSIVNKMISKLPKNDSVQLPPQAREEITRQVQSIMYASVIGQELVPYPEAGLDSSMTWEHSQTAPVSPLYTISTTAKYRIISIKRIKGRRIATITATFTGKVSATPPPPQFGATLKLNSSSITGDGTAIVDLESGATISKKNKVSISLSATVTEKATGKVTRINNTSNKRFDVELLP